MSYTWQQNLRFIAEYINFEDAPALLGVSLKTLTAWARETATPSRKNQLLIEAIADRLDAEQLRDSVVSALKIIGRGELDIPARLPPLLRTHQSGAFGSPVYIYDFRGITAAGVQEFFRFMKHIAPNGYFFFTYELKTAGVSVDENGMFFSDRTVDMLKNMYQTRSPIDAIRQEIGTASAHLAIDKVRGGFSVQGIKAISTQYMPFCVLSGPGTCEIRTDFEFFEVWHEYNDPSSRREVVEVGVSYPRPLARTPEEIAEDEARGADPNSGLVYIWQD